MPGVRRSDSDGLRLPEAPPASLLLLELKQQYRAFVSAQHAVGAASGLPVEQTGHGRWHSIDWLFPVQDFALPTISQC